MSTAPPGVARTTSSTRGHGSLGNEIEELKGIRAADADQGPPAADDRIGGEIA